ncbi:hypothetical protein FN846DRAFT_976087 [Sphaerosporella brunnea]|uniref:Secreted protein n=1 Tax=Sphaerosporella brunnea TaxID=1250544 RepID=A0A5J5EH74_9PEZI|nr:hypothetical protein FN846DRAFT_976087 [Sphaerosporella brunnea]
MPSSSLLFFIFIFLFLSGALPTSDTYLHVRVLGTCPYSLLANQPAGNASPNRLPNCGSEGMDPDHDRLRVSTSARRRDLVWFAYLILSSQSPWAPDQKDTDLPASHTTTHANPSQAIGSRKIAARAKRWA